MMRFTVASWHQHHNDPEWWIAHNAYTIMVSPPKWAKERNLTLFAATAREVYGDLTPEEYTARFSAIMRARLPAVQRFITAHANQHVILLCACPDGQFCHRHLVAKLLKWLGCEEVPLPCEESEPMEDIVVTVPLSFGLDTWIDEGDPAGTPWSGEEWHFYLGSLKPSIKPGGRVYIVYNGILRGYAPLVRVDVDYGSGDDPIRLGYSGPPRYALVRHGCAVAVTIDEHIPGFRGFRARWWKREDERPFDYPWYDGRPAWQKPMEWERRECVPNHPNFPAASTHKFALLLDGIPIAGYYKAGKGWHCTRCDEVFLNAAAVQEHIKGTEDHIWHAVKGYLARKAEREAVSA